MTKRLVRLVADLSANPTQSIPVSCGGWAVTEAAYRLPDNDSLDRPALLDAQSQPTMARMAGQGRVLCLRDTTELGHPADYPKNSG